MESGAKYEASQLQVSESIRFRKLFESNLLPQLLTEEFVTVNFYLTHIKKISFIALDYPLLIGYTHFSNTCFSIFAADFAATAGPQTLLAMAGVIFVSRETFLKSEYFH